MTLRPRVVDAVSRGEEGVGEGETHGEGLRGDHSLCRALLAHACALHTAGPALATQDSGTVTSSRASALAPSTQIVHVPLAAPSYRVFISAKQVRLHRHSSKSQRHSPPRRTRSSSQSGCSRRLDRRFP